MQNTKYERLQQQFINTKFLRQILEMEEILSGVLEIQKLVYKGFEKTTIEWLNVRSFYFILLKIAKYHKYKNFYFSKFAKNSVHYSKFYKSLSFSR